MPTRLLQSISLRLVLIVPYVLLLVGLAVALGVLSYSAGSRALSTVSGQLLLETVGRITQAVDRHVVGSSAVLESAFPEGMPAPPTIEQDFHDIRNRFWVATSIHTDPNDYVYYGNEAGQGLGLHRRSSDEVELRMKLRADEHRAIYRYQGVDGHLEFVRRETTLFDPRTRPWYANGKTTDGHTWTSVYIDFGTLQLVATRARRVLGPDNEFAGVVATDVALKALNDFVGRLKVSPNGIAFIVEPDGNLIASSASANVVVLPDGSYGRLQAAESDHPLLKASYLTVRDRIAVVSDEKLPRVFEFVDPEGNQIHAAIDRVRDAAGLDWVTVVAMPASDFLGDVIENVRRTVVLATIAVMVAVAIGLGILSWVSRDLRSLAAVASRIGDGDLETPVGIVRRDEIGELARSFERMQDRLRTDRLTGLANREALLQQLQRRIERARNDRRNPHVGVLFIDLNRFKSINDNHGHEIGDQVLQEIANRLAHSVRAEDLVARYAGDEFVIVTDNVTDRPALDQVRLHVEAVLRAPLTTPQIAGLGLSVGGAIGGALYPDDGDSPESLLRHADHAMYADKLDRRRSEPSGVVRFPQRP
ncbi:diguanylate cyclase domain-containing protein [Thauera mechernichensis]|uniref:Diguanylate cyclase domain-containing protein n=1 Tax=Thauera mechernichensis TaxID=82788 RepID=A0ABW3WEJ3_9RHOO|nr:diguanylate cyclase [Thauera mechernichensis]MDG3063791.1 diguanylate cyclase [Thauera mechernichensis]